jgi:hypothetical protein
MMPPATVVHAAAVGCSMRARRGSSPRERRALTIDAHDPTVLGSRPRLRTAPGPLPRD